MGLGGGVNDSEQDWGFREARTCHVATFALKSPQHCVLLVDTLYIYSTPFLLRSGSGAENGVFGRMIPYLIALRRNKGGDGAF